MGRKGNPFIEGAAIAASPVLIVGLVLLFCFVVYLRILFAVIGLIARLPAPRVVTTVPSER